MSGTYSNFGALFDITWKTKNCPCDIKLTFWAMYKFYVTCFRCPIIYHLEMMNWSELHESQE
jgi:hypothetical protein